MSQYCHNCMKPINGAESICPHCGKEPFGINQIHQLKSGTVLRNRYIFGRVLGQGGFGVTYIGRDMLLNVRVAIKEFYPNGCAYRDHTGSDSVVATAGGQTFFQDGKQKFLREAQTLARFKEEPGIVNVHDFFEENNTAYIVMEYLDGITLKLFVNSNGRIPANTLLRVMWPLIHVLEKIHSQGIIHRDISPDNIMVLRNGTLKLLDFGSAREVSGDKSLSVVLKPGFAPEEQYRSKGKQGPWTDVYSLCATMYYCLTGERPEDSVERVVDDSLRRPSALGVEITPAQESVLLRGMAVRASDRYQTMAELATALENPMSSKFELPTSSNQPNLPKHEPVLNTGHNPNQKLQSTNSTTRRRMKRGLLLLAVLCSVATFVMLIFVGFRYVYPEVKYRKAQILFESAQYSQAAEAFLALGDYKDSKALGASANTLATLVRDYASAENLLQNKQYTKAADAFLRLDGYKDARDRCFAIWNQISKRNTIAAGNSHTVGLKADGTVVAVGYNDDGQCEVSNWTDLVAIAADNSHTVGLKADGTAVAAGSNNYGECEVSDWADLVAIAAGNSHTVGLKVDGTAVAVGYNGNHQCEVSDWTNLVDIAAGVYHTVGLKEDGTAVAVGSNNYGECDITGWTDLVAIEAGAYHTVGLKSDGTAVAVGLNKYGQCQISNWSNLVSIAVGFEHTVGLKSDGTAVAVGLNGSNQCDVSGWTNLVSISAGDNHTIGLKKDQTVVAVGFNKYGQCNISDWRDIRAPATTLPLRNTVVPAP